MTDEQDKPIVKQVERGKDFRVICADGVAVENNPGGFHIMFTRNEVRAVELVNEKKQMARLLKEPVYEVEVWMTPALALVLRKLLNENLKEKVEGYQ